MKTFTVPGRLSFYTPRGSKSFRGPHPGSVALLIPKDDPVVREITAEIKRILDTESRDVPVRPDHIALRDGDLEPYDGYEGHYFIACVFDENTVFEGEYRPGIRGVATLHFEYRIAEMDYGHGGNRPYVIAVTERVRAGQNETEAAGESR